MPVFMTRTNGKCALFDEAVGGGAFNDPAAPRNAPLLNPAAYLANIYFHSDLDYLEVAFDEEVRIAHASSGAAPPLDAEDLQVQSQVKFRGGAATSLLLTHNLGYIPDCLVAVGTNAVWPGMPIQTAADGRGRYAVVYATATQIRLHTYVSAGDQALPAITLTYRVIVFKQPPTVLTNILFEADGPTKRVRMGRGKFDSDRKYLQVVAGGSPFGLSGGRPGDTENGAVIMYRPNGSAFQPVPASLKARLRHTTAWGPSMAYDGSHTAPASIQVQAP